MTVRKTGYDSDISATQCLHFSADTAGDVLYLASSTFARNSRHVQYACFQSSQAGTVFLTLSKTSDAVNPDPAVQAGVLWDAGVALTAKEIVVAGKSWTALKFTFTAPGELHVVME